MTWLAFPVVAFVSVQAVHPAAAPAALEHVNTPTGVAEQQPAATAVPVRYVVNPGPSR